MKGFREKMYNWLRMRSIYRRVKNVSVVIGTAAMVLITVISLGIYFNSTMELLQERETRYLSAYSTNIVSELYLVSSDTSELANCEAMQQMLAEQYPLTAQAHQYKQLVLTQEAEQILAHNDAVSDVYLFTTRDDPMSLFRGPCGDVDVDALDTISMFYDTSFFSADGACFMDAAAFSSDPEKNNQGLVCLHRVMESGTAKTRGYLLVYLDKQQLFGDLDTGADSDVYRFILDESGSLVYSVTDQIPQETLDRLHSRMTQKEGEFGVSGFQGFSGGMCVYSRISGLDFYAVTLIPYSVVSMEIAIILLSMLVLLALLFCIYSVMSQYIAESIALPVEEIIQSLRQIQQEDFQVGPYDGHSDELAEVNNFMNETKQLLSELITKIKVNEQQRYELQLQVLRTQINPHFLVNTLNSIIWLANLQGAENIRSLTTALIDVLVPCMRNTSGVAPIRGELALLRDYCTIMEFQYMNQFQLEFDVEEAAQDYLAPVLFLQPLVENALIHGRDLNSPMLHIHIRGRVEEDRIHIQVRDDGKGITSQRMKEITERTGRKKKVNTMTRIGVTNIRERMGLLYGDKGYSLTITSEENHGTLVDIRLPMLREEEHNEKNTPGG